MILEIKNLNVSFGDKKLLNDINLTVESGARHLLAGHNGSGKSTTLAAMLDHINHTKKCHIVTLEDPVEYNIDGATQVQMNDKFVTVGDIVDYISRDRAGMSAEDLQQMTVSIKADKATPMGIITDVKQALRQANALRINYSGEKF